MQVETAKIHHRSLAVLDDEQENRSLLYKIPDFCHSRWSRKVAQNIEEDRSYPSFSDFCKFIRIEANVVNNQVTCIRSPTQTSDNRSRSNHFQSNSNSDFRSRGQGRNSQTFANRSTYSHAAASAPTHKFMPGSSLSTMAKPESSTRPFHCIIS